MNKNEGVRVIFVIAFLGLIRILVKKICRVLQVYDSENDQIDLMIPAQKSVWKIIHLGQWYGQKCTEFWQAKPNYCTFVLFGWYLRPQCIFFQTDFCVGTMISRHMFGVLYTWIKQQQKFYQNRPYTSKSNYKNGRHSPIFRCVSISISAKFTDKLTNWQSAYWHLALFNLVQLCKYDFVWLYMTMYAYQWLCMTM